MKPVNIFDTYSKWFKLLNALFIPFAILELVAIKPNILSLVASILSGIYFGLWFVSLIGESIYRIIRYLIRNRSKN